MFFLRKQDINHSMRTTKNVHDVLSTYTVLVGTCPMIEKRKNLQTYSVWKHIAGKHSLDTPTTLIRANGTWRSWKTGISRYEPFQMDKQPASSSRTGRKKKSSSQMIEATASKKKWKLSATNYWRNNWYFEISGFNAKTARTE